MRNPKYTNIIKELESNKVLYEAAVKYLYFLKVRGKSLSPRFKKESYNSVPTVSRLIHINLNTAINKSRAYWPEFFYGPLIKFFDDLEKSESFKAMEARYGKVDDYDWDVAKLNLMFKSMSTGEDRYPIRIFAMAHNNSKVSSGYDLSCQYDESRCEYYFQLIHKETGDYVNSKAIKNPTIKRAIRFLRNNVLPAHKAIESDKWRIQVMLPAPTFASWYVVYFDACTGDLKDCFKK